MYIVNSTFVVEPKEDEQWRNLLVGKHIPMLQKEGFDQIVFTKILTNDSPDAFTYSLQVRAKDMEAYGRLTGELFDRYQSIASGLFEQRVLCFTTLLKLMNY